MNPLDSVVSSNLHISGGFSGILNWAIGVGGLIALGVIIYGGVLWISSAGNASLQKDAKDWIKAAVYGMVILLGAYLLLNTINPAILGR